MTMPEPPLPAREAVHADEYERALELWPNALLDRITNALIVPTWIDGHDRFWYRLEHRDGYEFLLVDAATGHKQAAFDHQLLARVLDASAERLPIETFTYDGDALVVTLTGGTQTSAFNGGSGSGQRRVRVEPDGTVTALPTSDPNAFRGPNGLEVFVDDHNLWVRDGGGGAGSSPLTARSSTAGLSYRTVTTATSASRVTGTGPLRPLPVASSPPTAPSCSSAALTSATSPPTRTWRTSRRETTRFRACTMCGGAPPATRMPACGSGS